MRCVLFWVLCLCSLPLGAFGGGWYGISGAKGVPAEWLAGSPFTNYFIPGLISFIVVGGSFLAAAIAVVARLRHARLTTLAASVILLIWIATQVAIIGHKSWLQPTMAAYGVVVLVLALLHPDGRAQRRQTAD